MELTLEGCINLVIGIFQQAAKDAETETFIDWSGEVVGWIGQDAREFLAPSPWARFLLESLGIDPGIVEELAYG